MAQRRAKEEEHTNENHGVRGKPPPPRLHCAQRCKQEHRHVHHAPNGTDALQQAAQFRRQCPLLLRPEQIPVNAEIIRSPQVAELVDHQVQHIFRLRLDALRRHFHTRLMRPRRGLRSVIRLREEFAVRLVPQAIRLRVQADHEVVAGRVQPRRRLLANDVRNCAVDDAARDEIAHQHQHNADERLARGVARALHTDFVHRVARDAQLHHAVRRQQDDRHRADCARKRQHDAQQRHNAQHPRRRNIVEAALVAVKNTRHHVRSKQNQHREGRFGGNHVAEQDVRRPQAHQRHRHQRARAPRDSPSDMPRQEDGNHTAHKVCVQRVAHRRAENSKRRPQNEHREADGVRVERDIAAVDRSFGGHQRIIQQVIRHAVVRLKVRIRLNGDIPNHP